jgi:hypothetical protein
LWYQVHEKLYLQYNLSFWAGLGKTVLLSRIPDPNFCHPGSASASKNFGILAQKIVPRSRKYDPGCSSRVRILDPDLDFLPIRIQDPVVKKAPDPGSGSATLLGKADGSHVYVILTISVTVSIQIRFGS